MSSENKKTLLLVEDEAIIAIAQKKNLERYGYNIITANDGERAFNLFAENSSIDLILMDIDLGKGIDGTEAAKRILNHRAIPVVFLSSHTEPEIVEKTEKITSYGYVVKNSGITVLDASIKMAFKLFEANRKIEESEAAIRKKLDAIIEPEGDIGTLELADIIDSESLQAMMNDFYRLTRIGVGVLDINGKVLVGAGWQDICTDFHRRNPETLKNCIESDVYLSKGIAAGEFKTYRCKNGMWDMMTPIVIGGKHLGNISLGQFFYEDEVPDYEFFRSQAQKFGFDEKEYMAAVDRVARFSRETVNATMFFYAKLAAMISSLSYSRVNLSRTLSQKDIVFKKLAESEIKQNAMISNISDVIGIIDKSGVIKYKSSNIERLFGWQPEDLVGGDGFITVHPDDLGRIKNIFIDLLEKDNSTRTMEFRYKCKDGSFKPVELTATNLVNNPVLCGVLLNYHDISERKQAEEILQFHSIILENLAEGVQLTTLEDSLIVYTNPTFESMFGYGPGELTGKHVSILNAPGDPSPEKVVNDIISEIRASGRWQGILRNVRKDGSLIWCSATVSMISHPVYGEVCVTLQEDISKSKMIQDELRESEQRYRSLFNSMTEGFALHDIVFDENGKPCDYRFLSANPAFERLTGLKVEDITGKLQSQVLPGEDSYWLETYSRVALTGEPVHLEHYSPVLMKYYGVFSYRPAEGQFAVIFSDITERKQSEEQIKTKNEELEAINEELNAALEEMEAANEELVQTSHDLQIKEKDLLSEKIFTEALLECIPGYLYVYDDQGNLIKWNKKHEEMTGYSAEELSQMNMSKWFEGEDAVRVAAAVDEVFSTGYGEVEANLLIKGGKKLLIHSNGVRLTIDGKTYFTGVGMDITERKRAEDELKRSQLLLKSSIESPKDMIILSIDNRYNYLYFNSYHKNIMMNAYGVDVRIGMSILECITNEQDRIKAKINYGRALSGESHITVEEYGELDRQYYETRYNPIVNDKNEVIGATAFSADVTDRIRMQNELKKSEQKFDTILQTMADGLVTVDLNGRIVYSNQAAGRILCIGKDVLGRDYKSREWRQLDENGDPYPLEKLPLATAMRELREVLNVEHQIEALDGERKWLSVNAAPLFDEAGKLSGGVASFRDITENKRLVEELKKNQNRFEQMIKNSSDTIVILDEDGTQRYVSDAAERILGYKPDELINIPVIQEMIHPDDIEKTQAAFLEIISKGYGGTRYRHKHKKGGWVHLEGWGTNQLSNPDIKGVVVNVRDITERVNFEDEIQLDEARLESLLKINQHSVESIQNLLDFALNEAIGLTGSKIGYIYFYDENKKEFNLNTWSKEVMQQCAVVEKQTVYQLEKTGLWGEAVRQRRPIMDNDFSAPNSFRKGLPEGHNPLKKFLTIPVVSNEEIVAVVGVANKESDYNDSDIRQLNLMMDSVWKIVQRKKAEENVQKLLREKELLLQEVHHRIKNNMNTIKGLIKLQADAEQNPEIANVLFDAESRVISMMILYDRLYRSDNYKVISIKDYIPELADEIISNFPSGKKVKIVNNLDDFTLEARILQPLGIIINELITNMMKYAFAGRDDGTVAIGASIKDNHAVITIEDNGVGIPESIQFENSTGFGMQLVGMLTEQIGGTIRIERGEGTKFVLEFDV